MMNPVFSAKLDALPSTLDLLRTYDPARLSAALAGSGPRHVLAIGSGGSAISAEYLARCRDSLGLGPTRVQTPMQIVLDHGDLTGSEVWLFSAGGGNPDVVAAAHAALDRGAAIVHLLSRNPEGEAARVVERHGGQVHPVPVADPKDGYLATHSLLSFTGALLLASDAVSRDPSGAEILLDALAARLTEMRDREVRNSRIDAFAGVAASDTLILAIDPLLRPVATLLDTSIWEASLCSVQTTDLRNFAHGRHAWLYHRASSTFLIALTGVDSEQIWSSIDCVLPDEVRRVQIYNATCGRLANAMGLIDGLGLIEALGARTGIDPGKPGIGEFGREVYDDRSLAVAAEAMPARVRHKRAGLARSDSFAGFGDPLHLIGRERIEALAQAYIGALVLDYDGTIVTTEKRWSVPDPEIVSELVRLVRAGVRFGIATGRGGSAGEDLRKVLPADILTSIPIGYYNGGHVRMADVDIRDDPAPENAAVTSTASWLNARRDLFQTFRFKHRGPQITVDMDTLHTPYRFPQDLQACDPFRQGLVRVLGSGHSYDIVPTASSKLTVVQALAGELPTGHTVLCFGDSGSRLGNDHALLSHVHGISVGEVCGAPNGCWSLFGHAPTGPSALLKILRALIPSETGAIRLDVASLGLDRR